MHSYLDEFPNGIKKKKKKFGWGWGGATLIISKLTVTVNELFVEQGHNISMKNDFFILNT